MTRNGLRGALVSSVASVTILLFAHGVALATTSDDPSGTITDPVTDPVDDLTDPITDAVDDPTDPITDAVDDPTDPITDAVDDPTDPVTDAVDDTTEPITDAVDDNTVRPIAEAIENAPPAVREQRGYAALSTSGSSDVDELAQGGNEVVAGSDGPACIGSARVVCLDLVGGLGPLGLLFRVARAGNVMSSFTDALARTGIDVLWAAALFVILTVVGIVLVSVRRRPEDRRRRGRSPVGM